MIQQAIDFGDDSEALYALLAPLSDRDCLQVTQFKGWTLDDVIGHLHIWNYAAHLSLADEISFLRFLEAAYRAVAAGKVRAFEGQWLAGCAGSSLRGQWRDSYLSLAEDFAVADPSPALEVGRAGHERSLCRHRAADGDLGPRAGGALSRGRRWSSARW